MLVKKIALTLILILASLVNLSPRLIPIGPKQEKVLSKENTKVQEIKNPPPIKQSSEDAIYNPIPQIIEKYKNLSIEEKINNFSRYFMGKPYWKWPLGEGNYEEYNQKPLFRFDYFDCTTYIETVLALACSNNFNDFKMNIVKIRYKDAKVSFFNRNHFASVDWIPNNCKSNLFTDITSNVAKNYPVNQVHIVVDKKKWYEGLNLKRIYAPNLKNPLPVLSKLRAKAKDYGTEERDMDYISLKVIFHHAKSLEILNNIPSGAIINIIKREKNSHSQDNEEVDITHQGFCIHINGIPYLRHASLHHPNEVTEIPLRRYLGFFVRSDVLGINILQVNQPTPFYITFAENMFKTIFPFQYSPEKKSNPIRVVESDTGKSLDDY